MFHLNIRRKMIGIFCLHLLFYTIFGIILFKDFDLFKEEVSLIMHAGNLSNICLEIRRYEKNFIIRNDEEDYRTALRYVDKAMEYIPKVKNDLKIVQHPVSLQDITIKLAEYKDILQKFHNQCASVSNNRKCKHIESLRILGHDFVTITEELVEIEQEKMLGMIFFFKKQLVIFILIFIFMSIFSIFSLYRAIIIPLKSIERAAKKVSKGNFSPLKVSRRDDEASKVIHAFNKMVKDLASQQEQLFQAKKLSSIGTLASGIAHQINNPLNNISTSSQLALAEIDHQECEFIVQMLETIEQETCRAGDIVRGLLEFSRSQTFSMQPVLLKDILKRSLRLVASEIPSGVKVTDEIPEDICLLVDIQKLVEVFINLIINSTQAIAAPPGEVSITAEKDEDVDEVIIKVKDTGVGISKEDIQKIFDPFFTTKTVDKGTGLGLAVVFGIIKKQRGSINAESTLGKGTTVIIRLPLCHEKA